MLAGAKPTIVVLLSRVFPSMRKTFIDSLCAREYNYSGH